MSMSLSHKSLVHRAGCERNDSALPEASSYLPVTSYIVVRHASISSVTLNCGTCGRNARDRRVLSEAPRRLFGVGELCLLPRVLRGHRHDVAQVPQQHTKVCTAAALALG